MSKSQQPAAMDMAVQVPAPTQPSSAPPATLAQVPSKPHYNELGGLIRTGTLAERTTLNSTITRVHVKQPGMPTFNEVHSCFSEVRAYYKGGVKSSNKFYYPLDPAQFHQGGEVKKGLTIALGGSPKTKLRHDNLRRSAEIIKARYMRTGTLQTPLMLGRDLYAEKSTSGNCGVMTAMAANFFNKRFPEANLYLVSTTDHALMVCGAMPPVNKSVDSWKDYQFKSASYVIDVWMNICCETNEYPALVTQKLNKWAGEGKGVLSGVWEGTDEKNHVAYQMEDGNIMTAVANIPNSQLYRDALLHSVVTISSIK